MSNTIKVSGGFSVGNSEPVDDRTLVANITARDAIESYRRYVGMETTVLDGGGGLMKKYKLSGGIANSNWVDISDNGTIQARSTNATANTIPLRDSNGKFQIKLDVDRIYIGNTFGNAEPRILPYSLTGHGGKALAVRSDLTGYEYVPFPTGSLNNVTVKSGVTGLTATKTGDTVELDASYPSALVQSATGYQVLKNITGNKLVGATLVQGANINISETTGETISGIPTKRLTISSQIPPITIAPGVQGATATTDVDGTVLSFDYPSMIGGTSGIGCIDRITNNSIIQKPLREGNNISITEVDSGATVGNPPIPLKYIEISTTNYANLLSIASLPSPASSGTLTVDLVHTVFTVNVGNNYTLLIVVPDNIKSLLQNRVYTMELHINMTAVSTVTFPANISWVNGIAPTINTVGKHVVALRTMDAGTTWIANLAYKY